MLLLLILGAGQDSLLWVQVHDCLLAETRPNVWDQGLATTQTCRREINGSTTIVGETYYRVLKAKLDFRRVRATLSESVVILMEGFLAVTVVLEPHLLLRPAAAPESCSPSVTTVPGDDLLPSLCKIKFKKKHLS